MMPLVHTAPDREPLHGVRQIIRFNWPFYLAAMGTGIIAAVVIHQVPFSASGRAVMYAAVALTALWTIGSLLASWIVYDRSALMKGDWIPRALGFRPRTWINIHAGFDETSELLRKVFVGANGRVFDMFDPLEMTEGSIVRARERDPASALTESVDRRSLPALDASTDAIALLLAAHELRSDAARCDLLEEAHRVLTYDGRVIVAEHLRDGANFAAFGPGFFHFHSRRTWLRCFRRAGFGVRHEFSITPFVRVFVLEKRV